MRVDGLWLPDETGSLCPILPGLVLVSGREYPVQFSVDSGAAQTVLGSDFASLLRPQQLPSPGIALLSAAGEVTRLYHSLVKQKPSLTEANPHTSTSNAIGKLSSSGSSQFFPPLR